MYFDIRLSESTTKILESFIGCLPLKNFWSHVFIIRTHADKSHKRFQTNKKKIEDSIVRSLQCKEFESFKTFMNNKRVELPIKITEFYVDCENDFPEETLSSNQEEFDLIFNSIEDTQALIKDIKREDRIEVSDGDGYAFPVYKTIRKITYIPQLGEKIVDEFLYKEDEKCNYPVKEIIKDKEEIETESSCGSVKIFYHYYEQKVYLINGQSIKGKRCKKGEGWESK